MRLTFRKTFRVGPFGLSLTPRGITPSVGAGGLRLSGRPLGVGSLVRAAASKVPVRRPATGTGQTAFVASFMVSVFSLGFVAVVIYAIASS
jgi:hypothetical protein